MVGRMGRTYRNVRGDEVDPDPAGIQQAVRLIGGMQAMVSSNAAAAQELSNAARELRILNERGHQMFGQRVSTQTPSVPDVQRDLTDNLTEVLRESLTEVTTALRQAVPAGTQGGQEMPPPPSLEGNNAPSGIQTPPGRVPSPASSQDMPDPEDVNGPVVQEPDPGRERRQEPTRTSLQEFERTRDYFGGSGRFNLTELRKSIGTRAQEALTNWTPDGEQLVQDEAGDYHYYDPEAEGGLGQYADEAAIAGFMRRERIGGALRGAAGTLAEGGTVRQAGVNMLPAGAARAAGVAGAAFYAADKVGDFAETQREENAAWQRASGGTNFEAFGERARSQAFQFGQFGVMGEGQAAALYEGVARTNMDRQSREAAEQFGVDAYKQFGMTVQQSLEIINTAAETGQESLSGLADALKDVTASAQEAGINAEAARQTFVDNWQTFSRTFTGPTATAMAQGFATEQAQLGPEFQGLDFSGVAADDVIGQVAAMQGMTYNQMLAQSMQPGGQGEYTEAWQERAQATVTGMLGESGLQTIAQQRERLAGEDGEFTPAQAQRVARELLADPNANVDVRSLIDILGTLGIRGVTPRNAMTYAVQLANGTFNPAAETELRSGETSTLGREGADGTYRQYSDIVEKVREDDSWKPWDDANEVGGAYLESVRATRRTGGISEEIAYGGAGEVADMTKVRVKTSGGPRVVSLEDAMRHFRDQIDAGTAVVAEGNKEGVTVSEAIGMEGDSDLKVRSKKNEDLADKGESLKEWKKDRTDSQFGGGGGTVTIAPAPALRRFLEFQGTGNINIDPSTALIPPMSHTNANGRPTGTPPP